MKAASSSDDDADDSSSDDVRAVYHFVVNLSCEACC